MKRQDYTVGSSSPEAGGSGTETGVSPYSIYPEYPSDVKGFFSDTGELPRLSERFLAMGAGRSIIATSLPATMVGVQPRKARGPRWPSSPIGAVDPDGPGPAPSSLEPPREIRVIREIRGGGGPRDHFANSASFAGPSGSHPGGGIDPPILHDRARGPPGIRLLLLGSHPAPRPSRTTIR